MSHGSCCSKVGHGLRAVGQLVPKHSRDISHSRCSVGCETLDRDLFDPRPVFPQMGDLGVKWARLQTGWAKCEREKGIYDFAWLDWQVDTLLELGITPWFNVSYGNPLYTPGAAEGYQAAVGQVPLDDPEAEQAWISYVRALVTHFRNRVSYYEVWNEPDIASFWRNLPRSGANYARLFNLTVPVVKQVQPDAKIVAVAMTSGALTLSGRAWLHDFFAHVADPGVINCLTFHSYRYPPDRDYEEEVALLRSLVDEYNPAIRLWQGESGYPSIPSGQGARAYNNVTSENIQAKWLTRHVLCNLGIGVELVSWHQAIDLIGYRDPSAVNPKGLLRGKDHTRKPSFHAYQRICSLFTGDVLPVCRRWGAEIPSPRSSSSVPEVKAYHYASAQGDRIMAYWRGGHFGEANCVEPATLWLEGDWSQCVMLDPLSGTVYAVHGEVADGGYSIDVPLADYALVLVAPAAEGSVLTYTAS